MFLLVNNVPNSVVDQPNNASSSLCKEDRKIDEFLDLVQKKSVSDEIRQRNKKLQRESRVASDLSHSTEIINNHQESKLSLAQMMISLLLRTTRRVICVI